MAIEQTIEDRVSELVDKSADMIREKALQILKSGAIDPDYNSDRAYWTPKMLVSAACEYAASQWENKLDGEWLEMRNNLRHF